MYSVVSETQVLSQSFRGGDLNRKSPPPNFFITAETSRYFGTKDCQVAPRVRKCRRNHEGAARLPHPFDCAQGRLLRFLREFREKSPIKSLKQGVARRLIGDDGRFSPTLDCASVYAEKARFCTVAILRTPKAKRFAILETSHQHRKIRRTCDPPPGVCTGFGTPACAAPALD